MILQQSGRKWGEGLIHNKGSRFGGELLAVTVGLMLLLSGCGDDAEVRVAAVSPTELIEELQKGENVSGDEKSSSEDNISADSRETADGVPEEGIQESGEEADSSGLSGTGNATWEKDSDSKGQKGNAVQEASKTGGGKQDTGDSLQESFPEGGIDITISAAGDATLGNHRDQEYWYTFDQTYDQAEDKGYFFANVQSIFEADDFTILNLEGPLTTSENAQESTYIIKGRPEYAKLLKNARIRYRRLRRKELFMPMIPTPEYMKPRRESA